MDKFSFEIVQKLICWSCRSSLSSVLFRARLVQDNLVRQGDWDHLCAGEGESPHFHPSGPVNSSISQPCRASWHRHCACIGMPRKLHGFRLQSVAARLQKELLPHPPQDHLSTSYWHGLYLQARHQTGQTNQKTQMFWWGNLLKHFRLYGSPHLQMGKNFSQIVGEGRIFTLLVLALLKTEKFFAGSICSNIYDD